MPLHPPYLIMGIQTKIYINLSVGPPNQEIKGPTGKILSSNGQKSEIYKKLIVYKKSPEAQG